MATTKKGIYYPNDYSQVADVPEDFKKLAESVDDAIDNIPQYDDSEVRGDISSLQMAQEALTGTVYRNVQELRLLQNNLPDSITTDQSEEITVQDAMNYYSKLDVSGNSTQATRSGKNIININTEERTSDNASIEINKSILTITKLDMQLTSRVVIPFKCQANTDYIVSLKATVLEDTTISGSNSVGIRTGSHSGSWIKEKILDKASTNVQVFEETFNSGDTTTLYLWLYLNSATGAEGTTKMKYEDIMIRLASNEDSSYEAFGVMPSPDYPSEIKNCKTSINIKVENTNKINLEEDDLNTYSYVVSNKSSNDITWVAKNGAYSWLTLKKYLKAGTYYLQRKYEIISGVDNLGQAGMLTVYTGDDKTLIKSIANNKDKDSFVITQDNYYNIHLIASNGTAQGNDITIRFYDLMLSEKDENYIEHKEQILTFPLVEGQRLHLGDYLADNGIHHKKQTIVFDGTENVLSGYLDETIDSFRIVISGKYNQMLSYQIDDKCSHFKNLGHTPAWGRQANTFALSSEGYLYIFFEKNKITSETEAKNWIAEQYNNGTPLTAEGTLEEEYVESYTEEQQAVYNELKNLILYKGYNYITCTDETKCKMQLTYRPDNNIKIKSLEERVAALESEATA